MNGSATGVLLDGSLESSIVAALAVETSSQPVDRLSLDDEFRIDGDASAVVEDAVGRLGEPIADRSLIATSLLCQGARHNVTSVLTGSGADELLAGHDAYLAQKHSARLAFLPRVIRRGVAAPLITRMSSSVGDEGALSSAARFMRGEALPGELRHWRWRASLTDEDRETLYTESLREQLAGHQTGDCVIQQFRNVADLDELSQQQYVDLRTYLVDNTLAGLDRISAANAMAARTPFLDHRVVEFVAALPASSKLHGFSRKHILRKAAAGLLPREALARSVPRTRVPLANWLRESLKPLMLDLLSEQQIRRRGLVRSERVSELVREHTEGRQDHAQALWALMVLELWQRRFAL